MKIYLNILLSYVLLLSCFSQAMQSSNDDQSNKQPPKKSLRERRGLSPLSLADNCPKKEFEQNFDQCYLLKAQLDESKKKVLAAGEEGNDGKDALREYVSLSAQYNDATKKFQNKTEQFLTNTPDLDNESKLYITVLQEQINSYYENIKKNLAEKIILIFSYFTIDDDDSDKETD